MSVADVSQRIPDEAEFTVLPASEFATQTELANRSFYLQVREIEGAQVSLSGGDTWNEKIIVVAIPDVFGVIADQVFDLKICTHQQYPQGKLDVVIKPYSECQ